MTGRIIIADDHAMFREGMLRTVQRLLPEAVVQEAGDIDTLILDLRVPGLTGLSQLADGGVSSRAAAAVKYSGVG
jgi:DNA-binding NarL/FixJ family response regulator